MKTLHLVSLAGICAVSALALAPASNPALDRCTTLEHHGKTTAASACYLALTRSGEPFLRAEGYFGLGQFDAANEEFRAADKAPKPSAIVKTEWGRMYLAHYQPGDAAKLFGEAIETDPNYAPAYLGMAQSFSQSFDKRAVMLAGQALEHDPKLTAAHELLSYLELEDNEPEKATEEAQKALSLSNEALDGMAVLASIDWLNGKPQSEWMDRILKINPVYGEAYATGGHFLEINHRYDEAIAWYRKAIALKPDLWSARSKLGINLMRLGETAEAQREFERCFAAHYRDSETINSLRFLDRAGDYKTFRTSNTELLLSKKEAPLLKPYMQPELEKAIATYERKYRMKLPGPVRLEVYPNHDDFIVRTLGLPGQGGLLGVTFGSVVAMDSPSARAPGQFNWASTMWHELSHVYVLNATHNLVPRWFTEGLAVHEEGAASSDWGDRMTPEIVTALSKKQLLPVTELDRGFVRPEFPTQVLVSYFEAGKICDFIAEKHGDDTILAMIHSYADRKTTAEAIEADLHESPAAFDKAFQSWLAAKTQGPVSHFDQWRAGLKTAYGAMGNGKAPEALKEGLAIQDLYPEYVGADSIYELNARVYVQQGNKGAAVSELERYRNAGGDNVDTLQNLAEMEQATGQTKQEAMTLRKLNFVYPENEKAHRMLASLALAEKDINTAVREDQAVLALQPTDSAESHYELAKALCAAHRMGEAKDQVLLALEAAPDFKPAQQLLLQLSQ